MLRSEAISVCIAHHNMLKKQQTKHNIPFGIRANNCECQPKPTRNGNLVIKNVGLLNVPPFRQGSAENKIDWRSYYGQIS